MQRVEIAIPPARSKGLIVKHFYDETLVYDTDRDKAHCLNRTAALVWKYCDGRADAAAIARRVQADVQTPIAESVVWYALSQLDRYHLLQERVSLPAEFSQMSRREFIQKLKIATAIAVPLIISVTAPTAAQAATCKAAGQLCTTNVECCSGICNLGTCS
jgi:coenzyme PQQ synthesis protein D (PqqD)